MKRSSMGLQIIAAYKLLTAVLLIGLGIGLYRQMGGDPGREAVRVVTALKLDPDNRYIHQAVEWVSGISPRQLEAIRLGTFLTALIYLIEGTGLVLRKHWAEYFTVIATGLWVPLEAYEVWRRLTSIRLSIFVINLAIVVYLIARLIREHRESAGAKDAPAGSIT